MDFFPNGFPAKARARVATEKILAYRTFDKRGTRVSSGIAMEGLVRDCILRIFLIFADELCAFGQEDGWTVDQIESQANEFLRRLTIRVLYDKLPGLDRLWISNSDGFLTRDAEQQLRQSPEWRKYENMLLSVAAAQTTQPQGNGRPKTGDAPGDQRAAIEALEQFEAGNRTGVERLRTSANQAESPSGQNIDKTAQSVKSKSTNAAAGNIPTPSKKRDPEVAKRRALVKSNAGVPVLELCQIFDRENVPPPSKWQAAGLDKWVKAHNRHPRRINVIVSKDRRSD